MSQDFLKFSNPGKDLTKKAKQSNPLLALDLRFEGVNEDIVSSYYWHIQFPYYIGKGYTSLKLEDYHYFTEGSQYGQNQRQIKGGSIRAFQENLQQLIQLIKVHMMPLLKEMKQAEFYQKWFDQITINDKIIQELKTKHVSNDDVKLKKARSERNEAINHIKDKWVSEVDGGKLWQMNRPATEQGLDFALLPNLFFGISLDNPLYHLHNNGKSIKEQLDEDVYPVDISLVAKEQVARFMYRFYLWLPTAIRETDMTFRIKVSTLKQFYAQLQMYISFMKPLLLEISKKSEGLGRENFYRDFENENPEFVNLFDYSYSFIKVLGIRNFAKKDRGKNELSDLDFTQYGLYLGLDEDIKSGQFKKQKGFLREELNGKYEFIKSDKKEITKDEFKDLLRKWKENPAYVNKSDLKSFPVMMMDFSQRRMNEIVNGPQGAMMMPFMRNDINYKGFVWNIYEIASYRQKLKEENLELLQTFVEEIAQVKEDLMYYVNYLEGNSTKNENFTGGASHSISHTSHAHSSHGHSGSSSVDYSLVSGPVKGLSEMFSPLIPKFSFNFMQKHHHEEQDQKVKEEHLINKLGIVEDTWKLYSIHKKTKGLMQY